MNALFKENKKAAIGMCVPPPFPGSLKHRGETMDEIIDRSLEQAEIYYRLGYHGVLLQNAHDGPALNHASIETTACMTAVSTAIHRAFPTFPVGIMMVWDGVSSLAATVASGADFIRVEHAYIGAEMIPAGIVNGQCVEITALRARLRTDVCVLADVYEPHAVQICPKPLERAAFEALRQCHADGLFISGKTTAESVALVRKVREQLPDAKLFLGCGSDGDNVCALLEDYDGVCVGTWIKDGKTTNPINLERAKRYLDEVNRATTLGK